MTEDPAELFLARNVPRETRARLERLVTIVISASRDQNLISSATIPNIWERHVVDSAQLLRHAPEAGHWLDIGSGAGFPGLVIAIMHDHPVALVEPRRLRAEFLTNTAKALDLRHVTVTQATVENVVAPPYNVITARAVAPLSRLFAAAAHLASSQTTWVLPKGRSAASELATARETWHGDFVMHPSLTDPDAAIIVARNLRPRSDVAR